MQFDVQLVGRVDLGGEFSQGFRCGGFAPTEADDQEDEETEEKDAGDASADVDRQLLLELGGGDVIVDVPGYLRCQTLGVGGHVAADVATDRTAVPGEVGFLHAHALEDGAAHCADRTLVGTVRLAHPGDNQVVVFVQRRVRSPAALYLVEVNRGHRGRTAVGQVGALLCCDEVDLEALFFPRFDQLSFQSVEADRVRTGLELRIDIDVLTCFKFGKPGVSALGIRGRSQRGQEKHERSQEKIEMVPFHLQFSSRLFLE